MKLSIKKQILQFLTGQGWVFGGVIEDYIRRVNGHKASNASRRCRELYNEGKLERRLVYHNGVRVVQYRLKVDTPLPISKPYCCLQKTMF